MNEPLNSSVQKIWQSQPVEVTKMSAEVIRKRASKLQHRVWWRNAREYVGSAIGITLFTSFFLQTHEVLFRIAFGLFIAAMVWIVVQLYRKASVKSAPVEADTSVRLRWYRAELQRQRDAVKNVWPWYLAPLVPGFIVYTVAYVTAFPHPAGWVRVGLIDAVTAAVFFVVWKVNRRAARCLQRMIDELDAQ